MSTVESTRIPAPDTLKASQFFLFRPQSSTGVNCRRDIEQQNTLTSDPGRFIEEYGLISAATAYGKGVDLAMFSLVDYMPGVPAQPHTMFAGQVLEDGTGELSTGTGVYGLIEDGNFSIYWRDDKLWQTDTLGSGARQLQLQPSGRLTLTDGLGNEVWAVSPDDPGAKAPFKCQLRSDGNLVVLDMGNTIVWDSKSSLAELVPRAHQEEQEGSLYYITQQHLVSARALSALKPADITAAFQLQPALDSRATADADRSAKMSQFPGVDAIGKVKKVGKSAKEKKSYKLSTWRL